MSEARDFINLTDVAYRMGLKYRAYVNGNYLPEDALTPEVKEQLLREAAVPVKTASMANQRQGNFLSETSDGEVAEIPFRIMGSGVVVFGDSSRPQS